MYNWKKILRLNSHVHGHWLPFEAWFILCGIKTMEKVSKRMVLSSVSVTVQLCIYPLMSVCASVMLLLLYNSYNSTCNNSWTCACRVCVHFTYPPLTFTEQTVFKKNHALLARVYQTVPFLFTIGQESQTKSQPFNLILFYSSSSEVQQWKVSEELRLLFL